MTNTQSPVPYKRRRLATIDLGSNSFLLLVTERDQQGGLNILCEASRMPRLAEGLIHTGSISQAALNRATAALQELIAMTHRFDVEKVYCLATSAVRECSNQQQVVETLTQAAGTPIEIALANEEARLTYVSVTADQGHQHPSMVVDIGGGSTEITWGIGARFDGGRSLKIGTVKLLDQFFQTYPVDRQQLTLARANIDQQLRRFPPLGQFQQHYGVAGSFTLLAAMDLKLSSYHPDAVAGYRITPDIIQNWIERLSAMSLNDIVQLPGIDPQRADVCLPGALIIERIAQVFGCPYFEVQDRGLRFGKVFDLLRGFVPPIGRA